MRRDHPFVAVPDAPLPAILALRQLPRLFAIALIWAVATAAPFILICEASK